MARKRLVALACVLVAFAAMNVTAQETEAPTEAPPEAPPLPDLTLSEEPKPGFWERFSLYVEAAIGSGEVDQIDSTITTGATRLSRNLLDLDEAGLGRAKIGWTLPAERGRFLLAFNGWQEDSFRYTSSGEIQQAFDSTSGAPVGTSELVSWWDISVDGGRIESTRSPPTWFDDGNGVIDPGELVFATDVSLASAATDDLSNRFQTWDFLFQRDFGGRRVSARWDAGLRYFKYEGNILAGAWLTDEIATIGYTDGVFNNLMNISQDTTGLGPTGSVELHLNFFRDRVTWYTQGKAAFLVLNLETSPGAFYAYSAVGFPVEYLVLSPDTAANNPEGLSANIDKSGWQLTGESGIRIRLFDELYLEAGYSVTAYQDAIALPVVLSVAGSAAQGSVALYNTQDLTVSAWHAGLGFQF